LKNYEKYVMKFKMNFGSDFEKIIWKPNKTAAPVKTSTKIIFIGNHFAEIKSPFLGLVAVMNTGARCAERSGLVLPGCPMRCV
jgi:hypothetical protein